MEKEEELDHEEAEQDNYYTNMDYSHQDRNHHFIKSHEMGSSSSVETHNQGLMVDYMFNNNTTTTTTTTTFHQQQSNTPSIPAASTGFLDRLSFAEVMQFADFGPKLALNQQQMITSSSKMIHSSDEETGIDPVYFRKFPVLSDRLLTEDDNQFQYHQTANEIEFNGEEEEAEVEEAAHGHYQQYGVDSHDDDKLNSGAVKRNHVLGGGNNDVIKLTTKNTSNNRRKRPRSVKTSEEVESQRMTHIAVERNRRKQMNEHLRVLRSLMPGSYVQRGDQASIIGGAIEFVRELEQLLQCLESQKRRRLYGSNTTETNNRSLSDQSSAPSSIISIPPHQLQATTPQLYPPPVFPSDNQMNMKHMDEFEIVPSGGVLQEGVVREEMAENKTCLAEVEVKVLGDDAMIKILSKRRPGQLLKTIAALEDLQLNILHTNITTIEQTVLYSFNVKVGASETARFSAEDIASSVQQIYNFIHASSSNSINIC